MLPIKSSESLVKERQILSCRNVSVEEEITVAGVIKDVVELFQGGVCQIGYCDRIPAGLIAINCVWEQPSRDRAVHQRFGIGERPFHLIIDDPADCQIARAVFRIRRSKVVAFTFEGLFRQQRMKNRIKIYFGEIKQILFHIACDGIIGAIPTGHGIDKRRHAHLNHLKERFFDRIFSRTGEHAVFKDVRHSGVIGRRGGETDGE